jgi:hypothetical protein
MPQRVRCDPSEIRAFYGLRPRRLHTLKVAIATVRREDIFGFGNMVDRAEDGEGLSIGAQKGPPIGVGPSGRTGSRS